MGQQPGRAYRALLKLLPKDVRERDGEEIHAAFVACRSREYARLGWAGVMYAWVRAGADVIATALIVRADRRRSRTAFTAPALRDIVREIRFAVRTAARQPTYTATVVLTLALAIGTPTAVFSVILAVLLRPLPYPEPDRLVRFRMEGQTHRGPVAFDAMPAAAAVRWGRESNTLTAMAVFNDRAMTLSSPAGPFRLTGVAGTGNLFHVLGVRPLLGRAFDPASRDARRIVLSHDTWERFFSRSPDIIDSTILLDGERYVVIGVMPSDFGFPAPETAFWVPLFIDEGGTRGMVLPAIARLRADAEMTAMLQEGRQILQESGDMGGELRLIGRTMQDQMVGGVRRLLWVLMAAVTVVFVIGCTNIALLLLTRGTAREREFSIRLALGISRGRLMAQLVSEVLVLAALGGLSGLALAAVVVGALVKLAPADVPRLQEVALDANVLAFTTALIVLTTVVFGLLAASRALSADPGRTLGRLGGESLPAGRASRRPLNVLAASQLALTMVLLVAAGLLLRSFVGLAIADQGFDPGGALAMQINLPSARYPGPAARVAFHERLLDRLRHAPGIEAAGLVTMMPNRQPSARFIFSSVPLPQPFDPMSAPVYEVRTASEGFFEAMGIPIISGRVFRSDERPGAEPVVVISERLARQQFPERDPVGEILYSGDGTYRVIGVVGDVRPAAQDADIKPAAYLPFRQDDGVFQWFATATVVARSQDPWSAAASLRSIVLSLDPEMPPFNVRTLRDEVSRLLAGPRFSAGSIAAFAFVALVLAALGVYGVMAYAAGLRRREIGVRMAFGATRTAVVRLMLRDGAVVVIAGLVAGSLAAAWLSQGLTGLLHEVTPADPLALVLVGLLLASVGMLATYVPARRTTRVNVVDVLRDQ